MVNIPLRFKRVAAAFDEVVRGRSCESSGSEHSADLCDMVNSFIEREIRERHEKERPAGDREEEERGNDDGSENDSQDLEIQDSLKSLLFDHGNDRGGETETRGVVLGAVEEACRDIGGDKYSSPGFNRRLMARLRHRGFDAGLCKSKWEKNGRCPAGDYEYVDVNAGGVRFIVEVSIGGEFTIARATDGYDSLLKLFPAVYVGKPNELKQVARLMCTAMRKSMKSNGIHVPPWRRLAYTQAKWFGSYKRTVNGETHSRKVANAGGIIAVNRSVGFAAPARPIWVCSVEEFAAAKGGVRAGNLSALILN